LEHHLNNVAATVEATCESACHKPLAEMIREMVEAFVDAKMERADISVALYRVSADIGGPALIKRINQRLRKAVEAMLQTAPDTKLPLDKFSIEIMLAAMAGAMRSLLENGPTSSTVRKSREQLVLLCQSYMMAATAKRV
jgi:Tetracyclin repressor-like, C-terminal domain